ncbi:tripartite tricarboxylate transporter substrate-binding protein [Pseudoroseomonas globiformis]|uniref:Tripartite tricarboxylate transporter substrate-binding protein n=1 Tax=Teichococcus globiformis TaxID=2307229 RepID=A0ABV7FWM5_9PROT
MKRRTLLGAAALPLGPLPLVPLARPALAQSWPSRPITLSVPFAAGGPTDVMARLLAQRLAVSLGQSVPVENLGGAGGIVGTEKLSRARPDGYTIGLGHMGTHAANPAFYKSLPYNPLTDFEPLCSVGTNPMIAAARPGLAKTVAELRDWVAKNPGQLTLANAGTGSVSFLGGLLFDRVISARSTMVPYRGAAPALQDTMNGVTDAIVDQAVTVIPQARGGTIQALAVAMPQRLPQLPDVPTAAEAGIPDFSIAVWNGAYAPKGTPEPILAKLAEAFSAALDDEALSKQFTEYAVLIPPRAERGREPLRRLMQAEVPRWEKLARDAGVEKQ